jgi:DNA repair photolyase
VITPVQLLTKDQIARLPERAREVVEYRKSGLSLNHIQGCPLGCAYCIRHTYGLWDENQPRALMSDAHAVEELVNHRYFQPHVTPIQLSEYDIDRLNQLHNLKVTLLFTYSGIDNPKIEPYPSHVAAESLKLMSAPELRKYRTVLYWRPLVPGLNDTDEHLAAAHELSQHADATVFTGLFYRDQIADYYKANGIPEPYQDTARRKIVPETLEHRVLEVFSNSAALFRKTSCAVSYTQGLPDYNGHIGIRELCDICPLSQLELCDNAHRVPTPEDVHQIAGVLPDTRSIKVVEISPRAAVVSGLKTEQPRYFLQHALGFQVHDERHPHHANRHGRADLGWKDTIRNG